MNQPPPRPRPRPTPGIPDRHLPRPEPFPAERTTRPGPEPRIESPPQGTPRPPQDASPHSVSPDVDRAIGKVTRTVVGKVWPILVAGLLGTGASVAYQRTTAPPERVDRQDDQLRELRRDLSDTRDELAKTKGELRGLRDWAVKYQSWALALEQARGVRIRQPQGAPPLPTIETTAPLRTPRHGSSAAPVMTVQTTPPTPPSP